MPHAISARPALAACAALLLAGCASTSYVDDRIGALERRQNLRMDAIEATAHEALDRAKDAQRLAEGKFVYSVVLSDDTVKFPTGRAALSPAAEKRLAELAQQLIADNRPVYLEIQGYTDNVGTPASNLRLAQARADAAMLFLHRQGIAANRMSTVAYGESRPVASNATAEGRARNRRITVVVLH